MKKKAKSIQWLENQIVGKKINLFQFDLKKIPDYVFDKLIKAKWDGKTPDELGEFVAYVMVSRRGKKGDRVNDLLKLVERAEFGKIARFFYLALCFEQLRRDGVITHYEIKDPFFPDEKVSFYAKEDKAEELKALGIGVKKSEEE